MLASIPLHQLFASFTNFLLTGGLIVLSVVARDCTVKQATDTFKSLTHQFFTKAHSTDPSVVHTVVRAFKCWLTDGLYDEKAFEETLIAHYGNNAKLFDSRYMPASGPKVAVTATTVRNTSTRVLSNYNGITTLKRDAGTFSVARS